ncbi:unnamed protein product [Ceratitis capitata]|uniref:(Mediterranean fruit fly) hypothetical protein n=1 Tax=Ceratitis capitata TaxID=7213 RepID=A0A811VBS5_CERCA|nr:unnamed protein product [Ceratitis capitata]
MFFKVALLCCLGLTAIHAKPLDGVKCIDMSMRTSDAPTATHTVRICAPEIESDVTEPGGSLLDIDVPARHLLPPNKGYIGEYAVNSNGYAENYAAAYPGQAYRMAPLAKEYVPMSVPALVARQPYDYQVINSVLPQEQQAIDFQPLEETMLEQQTKLKSIVEDVSTVKEFVSDLENHLKTVSDTLVTQEKDKKADVDVNIVMKLDPSLEELLRTMLTLAGDKAFDKTTTENSDKEFEDFMNYIRTGGRTTEERESTDTARDSTVDDGSSEEAEVFDVEINGKTENKAEDEDEKEWKEEETAEAVDEKVDDFHLTDEEVENMLNEIFGSGPSVNGASADVNDKEEDEENYINNLFSSAAEQTETENIEENVKEFDLGKDSDEVNEKDLDDLLNSAFGRGQSLNDYADDAVNLLQLLTYLR